MLPRGISRHLEVVKTLEATYMPQTGRCWNERRPSLSGKGKEGRRCLSPGAEAGGGDGELGCIY
jgi:hypothetical protein